MPCWKLIRDRVPVSDGIRVRVGRDVLEELLRAKIVEEAVEFASSGSVEELADLLEAVRAWLKLKGLSLDDVERIAASKRERVGGFEEGWLVFWPDRDEC